MEQIEAGLPSRQGRLLFAWSTAGGYVPVEEHFAALQSACKRSAYPFDPRKDVLENVSLKRLRQVLSFPPLLVGGNPFSTTSIYSLIAFLERKWGVHFPIGGTGALSAVHGVNTFEGTTVITSETTATVTGTRAGRGGTRVWPRQAAKLYPSPVVPLPGYD